MKVLLSFILAAILLPHWQFRPDHDFNAVDGWEDVTVPHDWAISGPFDRSIDLQCTAIVQNGETSAEEHTARSGGLPWIGKGCYRTKLNIAETEGRSLTLLFDGAMSRAQIFVNGRKAGFWPYGYNAFSVDITPFAVPGDNSVVVLLENVSESSRWYPGAGLFRQVSLVDKAEVHVPVWGSFITTPHVDSQKSSVRVETTVEGLSEGSLVTLETIIRDSDGNIVARSEDSRNIYGENPLVQNLEIDNPHLWSPESPYLYTAVTYVKTGGSVETQWNVAKWRNRISVTPGTDLRDSTETRFGVRSLEFRPGKGFFLNGKRTMFKGVCNHHDLGALGTAVNRSAIRYRLSLLKDMGCNAIRTSHNMPSQTLVELCDEMGFMLMVESFDEWDRAKCDNGYHIFFDEWAEKDLVNMVRHFRNNPSVVMWSIGNEVPSQWDSTGVEVCRRLQAICHREDPTRPVTTGMDQPDGGLKYGMTAAIDIPGFNYKPERYTQLYPLLPQGFLLGTETASTVSSRGVYHFPVQKAMSVCSEDHQCSSYDLDYCTWSNIPDEDFAADEDYPWLLGQFVWTGFDYLGEPAPYDTDAWPNHSSMFGIIDLANIPKDRYWLYRSIWNTAQPTLHVLPHWTWPGREGEITPVFVYTSYPCAELFVNGVSQGRKYRSQGSSVTERFRLMWNDTRYAPGEIRVVAYDSEGIPCMERTVRTAGHPETIQAKVDRTALEGTSDLAFITVSAVDGKGETVPDADNLIKVKVKGAGSFKAMANGDPTCLESFQKPAMHLFHGSLGLIIEGSDKPGTITVEISSPGLKRKTLKLENNL